MNNQPIILCENINLELQLLLDKTPADRVFLLTDEHTHLLCKQLIMTSLESRSVYEIIIKPEDTHKNTESLCHVWQELSNHGGSRKSLLINLGGGMVTDLGGFAASTFKRGIKCINIPTTLLAMVDASVGGKTGINFNGLKNEIGAFYDAIAVLIDTTFLQTLDHNNMLSGYGEMLKHGMIANQTYFKDLIALDLDNPPIKELQRLIGISVDVKRKIVIEDPKEQGIRKALNLGHTVGHAFESLALEEDRHILHGYAVAWGLICELYLSHVVCGLPIELLRSASHYVTTHYGRFEFTCNHTERLLELMMHDKKNVGGIINFTLLSDIGEVKIDQTVNKALIIEMLDFYREGL